MVIAAGIDTGCSATTSPRVSPPPLSYGPTYCVGPSAVSTAGAGPVACFHNGDGGTRGDGTCSCWELAAGGCEGAQQFSTPSPTRPSSRRRRAARRERGDRNRAPWRWAHPSTKRLPALTEGAALHRDLAPPPQRARLSEAHRYRKRQRLDKGLRCPGLPCICFAPGRMRRSVGMCLVPWDHRGYPRRYPATNYNRTALSPDPSLMKAAALSPLSSRIEIPAPWRRRGVSLRRGPSEHPGSSDFRKRRGFDGAWPHEVSRLLRCAGREGGLLSAGGDWSGGGHALFLAQTTRTRYPVLSGWPTVLAVSRAMALSKNLCRMLTRHFKSTHHEAESESVFAPLQTRLSRDGQALFPAPAPSPSPSHTVSVRLVVNGRNGIACRRVSALWAARGYPSIFMGKMGGPLLAEELAWSKSILGLARHNLHLPTKLLTCPSRCGDGMKRKDRTSTGIPTHGGLRNSSSSGFPSRKNLRG